MAKLALRFPVTKEAITLDTDKGTESLSAFQDGMAKEREAIETKIREDEVTPLKSSNEALTGYLADECVRLMRTSKDASLSDKVKTEEGAKTERDYYAGLPFERLQLEHKRLAGNVTVAKPETKPGEAPKAEDLDTDENEQTKLAAKFAPEKDAGISFRVA